MVSVKGDDQTIGRWGRVVVAVGSLVGLLLFSVQTGAETGPGEEVDLSGEQAELYGQAMDALDGTVEGAEQARTLLEAAVLIGDESDMLLLSLGRTNQLAGDCSEAIRLFDESEQAPPAAEVPAEEVTSNRRAYRQELEEDCGGILYVDCETPDTELISEDIDELECDTEIEVEPGQVEFQAALADATLVVRTDIAAGRKNTADVDLRIRDDVDGRESVVAQQEEPEVERRDVQQAVEHDAQLEDADKVELDDVQADHLMRATEALEESPPDPSTAKEHLEDARAAGESSWLLHHLLSVAHKRAGNCEESLRHFEQAEEVPKTAGISSEEMDAYRRGHREVWESECTATLVVDCRPLDGELYADGIDDLECNSEVDLLPGSYDVQAVFDGKIVETTVELVDTESKEVQIASEADESVADEIGDASQDEPAEPREVEVDEKPDEAVAEVDEQPREVEVDEKPDEAVAEVEEQPREAEIDEQPREAEVDEKPDEAVAEVDEQPRETEVEEQPREAEVDEKPDEAVAEVDEQPREAEVDEKPDEAVAEVDEQRRDPPEDQVDDDQAAPSETDEEPSEEVVAQAGDESSGAAGTSASPASTTTTEQAHSRSGVPSRFDSYIGVGFEFGGVDEPFVRAQMLFHHWYAAASGGAGFYPGFGELEFDLNAFGRFRLGQQFDAYLGAGVWTLNPSNYIGLNLPATGIRFGLGESRGLLLSIYGKRFSDGHESTISPWISIGLSPL